MSRRAPHRAAAAPHRTTTAPPSARAPPWSCREPRAQRAATRHCAAGGARSRGARPSGSSTAADPASLPAEAPNRRGQEQRRVGKKGGEARGAPHREHLVPPAAPRRSVPSSTAADSTPPTPPIDFHRHRAASQEDRDYRLMKEAVDEAYRAVDSGDGGPFGAVIVRDGAVLVSCHNLVRKNTDPSAHAEVTAIRQACKMLGKVDLSGCEIYASCEPCPMCLALIQASKIKKVVYGAKATAGVATPIPEAFVEYYRKSGIEVRQVDGEAARIAEKVFEKPRGNS